MKRATWVVMTLLATLVAAYSASVLLLLGVDPPFIRERLGEMPLTVIGHLGGGLVAVVVGAWQLNARLRARDIQLRRWMGRIYVVARVRAA